MKIIRKNKIYNIGYLKVKLTLNNTFITLTDFKGNVLLTKHAGNLKFRGNKKRTPRIAILILKSLIYTLRKRNIQIKGYIMQLFGNNTKKIFYNMATTLYYELKVRKIFYMQNILNYSHNGLRLKKPRRL